MLNFHSDRFYKLVAASYPVDTTDEFCILWKLKLSRERSFDMNVALILIKRKSIFWNVYFEAKFTPFIALGLSSTCEGSLINDLNTTQVAYKKKSSTDAKPIKLVSTD